MSADLRADNTIGHPGTGDVMSRYYDKYFNVNNGAYDHGPGRNDYRDYQILADNSKLVEDTGVVIRQYNADHLLWVNRDKFMPARLSENLQYEVTVLKFEDLSLPEETPALAVSRRIDIGRENIKFRSKRYGVAYFFEADRMSTQEGRDDFKLYLDRVATMFRVNMAYIALIKFLQPNQSDRFWQAQFGSPLGSITMEHLRREVQEFAEPHKSDAGALAMMFRYSRAMQVKNGPPANIVLFNGRKQEMFKFNNTLLMEYSKGGAQAPKRVIEPDDVMRFQGMEFRSMPDFPPDTYDQNRVSNMLTKDVEIGNHFIFRKKALDYPADRYNTALHDWLRIYSETEDNLVEITAREANRNNGRWDEDYNLHPDHWKLIQSNTGSGNGRALLDQYVYYDLNLRQHKVCKYIGDMEPEHLDKNLVKAAVRSLQVGLPVKEMNEHINAARIADARDDGTAVKHAFKSVNLLSKHLSKRLGGNKNPVFDVSRVPDYSTNYPAETHTSMVFFENCIAIDSTLNLKPGVNYAPDVTAKDVSEMWLKFKNMIGQTADDVNSNPTTEKRQKLDVLNKAADNFENILMHGLMTYTGAPAANADGVRDDTDKTKQVIAFRTELYNIIAYTVRKGDLLGVAVQNNLTEWNKYVIEHELLTKTTVQIVSNAPVNIGRGEEEDDEQQYHESNEGHLDTMGPAMTSMHAWMNPTNRKLTVDGGQPFSFLNAKPATPFREDKFTGEDGDRYTIKRGRVNNVENTFMYSNSTMALNVGWVLDAYENDIVGRAIALSYLSTPIRCDVFDTMLSENIHIPTEYLVLRPWMGYAMSAMVVAEGGVAMGESIYGYGDTKMSWATKNKSGDLHRTEWFGAIMYDYHKRIVIRHAFYEACLGGAGHRIYTDEHISKYINDREEYDENEERPSILICSIPYGSDVRNEALDICGRIWNTDQLNYATAAYYKIRYMFAKMNNQFKSLLQAVDRPRKNTVTFQGTSCQCGNINGDPGPLIENKGHHGKERPGSATIRRTGMTIMSQNAESFY